MPIRPQPGDEADQIAFRHRRATSRRSREAAPDMKEDCASLVRHGRIGVVSNLDQPTVGEIVMSHFLLCEPRWRMFRIVDCDQPVVVRPGRIVDPGIGFRDLMERKISSRGQRRIVGVDLADSEDAGGRAPVPLGFVATSFVLTGKATTPGEPFLSEEDRPRPANRLPWSSAGPLETLQGASHRVPVRGDGDNQLLAVVRDAGGTRGAADEKQPCWQKQSSKTP